MNTGSVARSVRRLRQRLAETEDLLCAVLGKSHHELSEEQIRG